MNNSLPSDVTQRVTVLRCSPSLVLAKTWRTDGTIAPYGLAKSFSTARHEVANLHDLSALLAQLEGDSTVCIIRGELRPGAPIGDDDRICRKNENFADIPRQWLALDIDDFIPQKCDPLAQPGEAIGEFLRAYLPDWETASHHWQLTGSAGHPGNEGNLKARAWFWLNEPRTSGQLKAWAKQQWPRPGKPPFDIALFSATQIHYTAAPIFEEGVSDPVKVRSGLKEGAKEAVSVPLVEAPTRQPVAPGNAGEMTAYARASLVGIYRDIAECPEGSRNDTLYQKAYRAFSFVHAGQAEEESVRQALEAAALAAGLDAEEIAGTLASAWSTSQKAPDDLTPLAGDGFDAEPLPEEALARVDEALNKAGDDPGALFEPAILGCLATIRRDKPSDWQRIRAKAKESKVQISELDRLTQPARGEGQDQGRSVLFPTIAPWPEPVDGATLVRELSDTLRQYVVCEPEVADTAALWIAFTWFIDVVHIAPIANITAPLPNCGKSTLLEFLELFAFQPLKCDGISSAALFRTMDRWQPTLLIDEVDTFLRDNEDARGVLNSGHKRHGSIIRTVGDDHEPKRFFTWGAKALCGIGSIASTLASRSIRLELRRKLPRETVDNLRFMDGKTAQRLKRQLCRLRDDTASQVESARPQPVGGLSNRARDNWEPLLQIADTIDGEWPERARSIAITISRMDDADQAADAGTELLKDIKTIFDERSADRLFTVDLVDGLCSDSEAPWNTWNRGKPITARQVGRKLAGFGIKSRSVRIGVEAKKGYLLAGFRDAFKRYLSPLPPILPVTTSQPFKNNDLTPIPPVTKEERVTDKVCDKLLNNKECDVVAGRIPPPREEGRDPWENHPLL